MKISLHYSLEVAHKVVDKINIQKKKMMIIKFNLGVMAENKDYVFLGFH